MKKMILSMIIGTACVLSAVADEYGCFYRPSGDLGTPWNKVVTLFDGDVMFIMGAEDAFRLDVTFPDGNMDSRSLGEVVGPCDVVPTDWNYVTYITYKIVRASDNSINPSNVISLPTDTNGDMQLVFESSDDLLTWDQVYSFTHNSTNQTSRFFRTRLIQGAGQ